MSNSSEIHGDFCLEIALVYSRMSARPARLPAATPKMRETAVCCASTECASRFFVDVQNLPQRQSELQTVVFAT
eukprot:6187038-Pleurochrysis_carterae.AAC.2